jgi:hypothetical protein
MARFPFRPSGAAMRVALLSVVMVAGAALSAPASAVGRLADIAVIDRDSGQVLPVHSHQGRHYVAGRTGARYAVRVNNRSNARVMAVVAVDGVNVVSGDTASLDQNGYVFSAWQRHDIAGWRKSQSEIAAFEFTALPNSYAARTGRPENVGVIGVALFQELTPPPAVAPSIRPYGGMRSRDDMAGGMHNEAGSGGPATGSSSAPSTAEAVTQSARKSAADRMLSGNAASTAGAAGAAGAGTSASDSGAVSRPVPQPDAKLGTGHGQRENAWVSYTEFQRAQPTPNEVITIYYDSRENLIAQGVIRAPRVLPSPQPFPAPPQMGFVPDPPRF